MNQAIQPLSDIAIEDEVCRWLVHDFRSIEVRFHDLKPDYLTQDYAKAIHSVVSRLHEVGAPIDSTIVAIESHKLVSEETRPIISQLITEFGTGKTPAGFRYLVSTLRDHWKRRTLTAAASSIDITDPDAAAATLREVLDLVADPPPSAPSMADVLKTWMDNLRDLAAGRKKPGILTGIPGLDVATCGGLRPGELWIVGGATSSGKTALEVQIAGNLLDDGNAVFVGSLEMPTCQVIDRLICNRGSVNLSKLRDPMSNPLTQMDMQSIDRVVTRMSQDWKFEIHDETCALHSILAAAQDMKKRVGLDVLSLDYLQIATTAGDYGTRERECADISRTLKRFAIAEHVAVIALSQLNDAGEIRESRAIGHDADVVMKIIEDGVVIQKNRNGQSGVVLPLILDGRRQTFVEQREHAA
ncbi:MAG: DnaB-like helicase C-terminal domain-containing protein [Verrucomicrobiota bacterium]